MRNLPVAVATLLFSLGACELRRPPQDNFLLRSLGAGSEPLVRAFEKKVGTTATRNAFQTPQNDAGEHIVLNARDYDIILISIQDNPCSGVPNDRPTFEEKNYRVDLIYRTDDAARRAEARKQLSLASSHLRQQLTPYDACRAKAMRDLDGPNPSN